jgi:hypothetical protein
MAQDTYIALPNGSYVKIPQNVTPEQMKAFRERLGSFAKSAKMTEAEQVAARPDTTAQAREAIKRPIEEAGKQPFSITLPQGTGALGNVVSGKIGDVVTDPKTGKTSSPYLGAREAQKDLAVGAGAMLGGELAAPAAELVEGIKVVPNLIRAAAVGAGAGAGAEASGETHKEAAKTGGEFAALDLGMQAMMRGLTVAYDKIFRDPKLTMQQASQLLGDALSKESPSPRQFGKDLQDTFDQISQQAGAGKREFISRVVQQHPDLTVNFSNTIRTLETDVNNLRTLKSRNPELFAQGEGMDRTLRILERELESVQGRVASIRQGMTKGNLADVDLMRSQLWNYKQQLDPSMASRIVGQLDRSVTDDITQALYRENPQLAAEYLEKSARYHELQNLGRQDTLKSIFGNERVAPGKVIEVMNQAPEDSLAAVRTLNRENPQAIQNLRRALFEQSIKTAGVRGLFKQQPALIREIYGPQADAVNQFVDVINRKASGGSLLSKLPGKAGAMFRIMEAGNRPGITIRASEMAKILKSAEMTRLFTQAAEMPANSGPAKLMRDTLERAMQAAGVEPETASASSRRPVWAEERRGGVERRATEGRSPTGTERRSVTELQGPDPMRAGLMKDLQDEINRLPADNPERKVLEDRLADMKAHPFEQGAPDYMKEARAATEKRMTREEAEAASAKRTEGRTQRFKDRRKQEDEE